MPGGGGEGEGGGKGRGGKKEKEGEEVGETVVNHFCVSRVCEVGLGSV